MAFQENLEPFFNETYGFGDNVQWICPTPSSSGYVLGIFDQPGTQLSLENAQIESTSPMLHVPVVSVSGVNNSWSFIYPSGSNTVYYVTDVQPDQTYTVFDITLSKDSHR